VATSKEALAAAVPALKALPPDWALTVTLTSCGTLVQVTCRP
jgi:hypothetical protein